MMLRAKISRLRQMRRTLRFVFGLLLACAMLLAVESAHDWIEFVLDAGTAYQRWLTGGGRAFYPSHTAILEINSRDAPRDVWFVNVCDQRLFVSRLLAVLRGTGPAVVVIDKYFSPGTCDAKPEGTLALSAAIRDLLNDGIPVVVGLEISRDYVRQPALDFDLGTTRTGLREGAVTLLQDERRVPLIWRDVPDEHGEMKNIDTLSMQAVLAKTMNLLDDNPRLRRFYEHGIAPYAGFLPAKSFDRYTFSAMRMLCGGASDKGMNWRTCNSPDQSIWPKLRGRVVLIGENVPGIDQHASVIGTIPGVRLQANYIEALLADDVFRPLPWWVTGTAVLFVFAIVELVMLSRVARWRKTAVVAGIIAAAYVTCWLAVNMTGIYVNPGIGILAALLNQGGHVVAHPALRRKEDDINPVAA